MLCVVNWKWDSCTAQEREKFDADDVFRMDKTTQMATRADATLDFSHARKADTAYVTF